MVCNKKGWNKSYLLKKSEVKSKRNYTPENYQIIWVSARGSHSNLNVMSFHLYLSDTFCSACLSLCNNILCDFWRWEADARTKVLNSLLIGDKDTHVYVCVQKILKKIVRNLSVVLLNLNELSLKRKVNLEHTAEEPLMYSMEK